MANFDFVSALDASDAPQASGRISGVDTVDGLIDAAKVLTAAGVTAEVDYSALDTAVGVLDADGASPTEAHADAVVAAWATLKSAIDDLHTAVDAADAGADDAVAGSQALQATVSGGLRVTVDLTSISTVSDLRKVFADIERVALSTGLFTE